MIAKITKRKSAFTLAEGGQRPHLNLGQRKSAFTLAEGGRSPLLNLVFGRTAFTLAEGGRRPLSNLGLGRSAFTLAEVLITLSVIGVVAALTIPSMIESHNNKAWSTAKDLWSKKLVEVTRQMNINGVMTGVASRTEDYMNYFKKYVKVIKTCENDKFENCYAPKLVQTGDKETKVEVSSLPTMQELADVATYIYKQEDNPIGATENRLRITRDSERAAELNWFANGWGYWSSEPAGTNAAYLRGFSSSLSDWFNYDVYSSGYRTRCFK